jgi:hypothetical protein
MNRLTKVRKVSVKINYLHIEVRVAHLTVVNAASYSGIPLS